MKSEDPKERMSDEAPGIQLKFKTRKPKARKNYNTLLGSGPPPAAPPAQPRASVPPPAYTHAAPLIAPTSSLNPSTFVPRQEQQESPSVVVNETNSADVAEIQQQLLALQKKLELLQQPGETQKVQHPPKKSGVWSKPKVWEPAVKYEESHPDVDLSNPDAEALTFMTKSDKQGQLYRDANSKAGRAALEKELFGKERHMAAGLDFDKYDNIPVESSGHNIPEPIYTFEEAELCKELLDNIYRANYTRPTPIQKHAIPMSMKGRDVMACAQTGSGKTAAFLFPIIHHIMRQGSRHQRYSRKAATPEGLILAPTRELASQIHDEAIRFTYESSVRCVVVYGGADIRQQMDELHKGCGIVVATPGRLDDLLERRRISLSKIKFLVLDEADRMLDMGFEPQIRKIVSEYDMPLQGRHTAMFSATFPSEIQRLAGDFMADYIFVAVGRVGSTNQSITQNVLYVENDRKYDKLVELLGEVAGLTLVFVETKRTAELLHSELYRRHQLSVTSIHGDRSQREREQALWAFTTGQCPILVATEIAARGLDIPAVMHVVNYDMPSEIDSYVHRIGRTGRAGNTGLATSFMNERNVNIAPDLLKIIEETGGVVPSWLNGLAGQAKLGRGSRGGGGGGGRGGRFGGRDFRKEQESNTQVSSQPQRGGGAPPASSAGSSARGGKKNRGNRGKGGAKPPQTTSNDAW